ncbi:hypothetical protein [Nocardia sp. NBC_01388]|uniref:hypothetical protein n=1 Tax=Nocardia sp. NBC_01388 TaxID=2903596 RepID=UPI0032489333
MNEDTNHMSGHHDANNPPDPFLAALSQYDESSSADEETAGTPYLDPAQRAAAQRRVLANLGFRNPNTELSLSDNEIADVMDEWSLQNVRGGEAPTGRGDTITVDIDQTIVPAGMTDDEARTLQLVVTATPVDNHETRISARIALPDNPSPVQVVVIATVIFEGNRPVRFPLQAKNEGTADFPLWTLAGGASIPAYGRITGAHIDIE